MNSNIFLVRLLILLNFFICYNFFSFIFLFFERSHPKCMYIKGYLYLVSTFRYICFPELHPQQLTWYSLGKTFILSTIIFQMKGLYTPAIEIDVKESKAT